MVPWSAAGELGLVGIKAGKRERGKAHVGRPVMITAPNLGSTQILPPQKRTIEGRAKVAIETGLFLEEAGSF